MKAPFDRQLVDEVCAANGLMDAADVGRATIRQFVAVVSQVEERCGRRYIRMEMGVPGLSPVQIGIEAEREAMERGIAAKYPDITGIPPLKEQASRFIEAFLDVRIAPTYCIPTVGSMQGAFVSFIACCQMDARRPKVLFLDPGFPVQKQQLRVLGYPYESFDIYRYRGEALASRLEEYLSAGDIAAIVYSNPNNPTWMCLTEAELQAIGRAADRYGTVVIEDLAYLNMDFRTDRGKPFEPPFQPSVARYTERFILLLSSSKIFSYAGQRGALVVLSPALYDTRCPEFKSRYGAELFGQAFIHSILYSLSAGVTHSVQYAMAAMMKAACDGRLDFVAQLREYERRARRVKEILLRNGFHIVYERDGDEPVGDGFFFTFGYKEMTGEQLINELLYYGVSAIPLGSTGSRMEGLRACVSNIGDDQYEELEQRLAQFNLDHS